MHHDFCPFFQIVSLPDQKVKKKTICSTDKTQLTGVLCLFVSRDEREFCASQCLVGSTQLTNHVERHQLCLDLIEVVCLLVGGGIYSTVDPCGTPLPTASLCSHFLCRCVRLPLHLSVTVALRNTCDAAIATASLSANLSAFLCLL